jgi:cysteine-rich repeat protein
MIREAKRAVNHIAGELPATVGPERVGRVALAGLVGLVVGLVGLAGLVGAMGGCEQTRVRDDLTGLDLTLQFDPADGIQQFRIQVTADGSEVLPPATVPTDAGTAFTSGVETLVILLPDGLSGAFVRVRADGLVDGEPVSTGGAEVTLQRQRLLPLTVILGPAVECGDGAVYMQVEDCDDGNTVDGDGCSSRCLVENGWTCSGEPSTCSSTCGNGALDSGEECDDGNRQAGDGCAAECVVEPGYTCEGEPSRCTGSVQCNRDADCDWLCDDRTRACLDAAQVLFVDCTAPCPGAGTAQQPLCRLQDALDQASPGQAIRVAEGDCDEAVTVAVEDVLVAGVGQVRLQSPACPTLVVDGVSALLRGIRVRGVSGTGGGVRVTNAADATLRRLVITGGSCVGLWCEAGSSCVLERSVVAFAAGGGVQIQGSDFLLYNNYIGLNGSSAAQRGGIRVDAPGASPAVIVNNTLVGNEAAPGIAGGVQCDGPATVRNTILWENAGAEVSGACEVRYCDVDQADLAGTHGNLREPPRFVDPGSYNFRLQTDSPCVDAGDPAGVPPAPPTDFDGQPRPQGNGVDIGADEAG